MLRMPIRKFASAAFNAVVVFGAASFAIAQNNGPPPLPERAAPLPLSALTASATPVLPSDPKPVPVVTGASTSPSAMPTAATLQPAPPPAVSATAAVVQPSDLQAPTLSIAPKAAAIDPIVEPVKRAQPTVANVKAAAKGKAAAADTKTEIVEKKVSKSKPATKVAAWKQKADAPVKKKIVTAKSLKIRTAKN